MAFIASPDRAHLAKVALLEVLTLNLKKSADPELVLASIDELIQARIEYAVTDLDNKISKSGDYDPDY